MSDEFNGTIEFREQSQDASNSQLSRIVTTFPTQSDKLEQHSTIGSSSTPRGELRIIPTHEDFDLIVDNCRRGRTSKSSATKRCLSPWNGSPVSRPIPERRHSSPTLPKSILLNENQQKTLSLSERILQTPRQTTKRKTLQENENNLGEREQPPTQEETDDSQTLQILPKRRPARQRDIDGKQSSGPKRHR